MVIVEAIMGRNDVSGRTGVEESAPLYPIESELDSMKYDNDDISIGEAVANNNGHFFVCNANILNSTW
jgi:hypothetical protein